MSEQKDEKKGVIQFIRDKEYAGLQRQVSQDYANRQSRQEIERTLSRKGGISMGVDFNWGR